MAASNEFGVKLIVFGGFQREGGSFKPQLLADVHCFDCDFNLWERKICKGQLPAPRHGHSAVLVPSLSEEATRENREHSSILVFGGAGEHGLFDDLHVLLLKGTCHFHPTLYRLRLTPFFVATIRLGLVTN
jgi:hypothetical protein